VDSNTHFLQAAEEALRRIGRPISVQRILQYAVEHGLLHTGGKTPKNTLRARLSEHIRSHGTDSVFVRVGPNRFGLRERDEELYVAPRFVKTLREETVVCVPQRLVDEIGRPFGFVNDVEAFRHALEDEHQVTTLTRVEADRRDDLKQLIAYVVLEAPDGRVLTYERGMYSNAADFLKGVRCIGFGGHVSGRDLDLFTRDTAGAMSAAQREIAEELKMDSALDGPFELVGLINDDSSTVGHHRLAVVYRAMLPDGFNVVRPKERSVRQLELVHPEWVWQRFHELEFWSQLLCRAFIPRPHGYKPVVIESRTSQWIGRPIVVVGEIGSGKSEVADHLQVRLEGQVVSTRALIAGLIGEHDFGLAHRQPFQDKASAFVSTQEGVLKFAEAIAAEARSHSTPIIDGVRNLETLRALRQLLPDLLLLYVEAPRDFAFDLFSKRSDRLATLNEFRAAREHPVEREVPLLKHDADAYVFNGGKLNQLRSSTSQWINEWKKP
jgi:predicted NUDIX family phosphoesterase